MLFRSRMLERIASDPEAQMQAVLASGLQDGLLSKLLEKRDLAIKTLAASQQNTGAQGAQVEALSNEAADLQERVKQRLHGIILGFEIRAESLKADLQNLQGEREKALGDTPNQKDPSVGTF